MQRDELLDLFHNYCVPYGQRKYRDSGRGKILNKARPMSPEPAKNIILMNNNQHKKMARMNTDRLKPCPEVLAGHGKRIKLEHKVSFPDPIDIDNNNKRKICLESTPATDSPPPKKERKPITWP
ncbi:hypothetical protein O3G_MSEX005236 [Manduca sexta]|uniref:Uncharacterized protein n=1 Tax=Manduca sexta TaxID=7130 RepID=A0A921YZ85_MANSE|nr:hypothetical protein O3G_MSEX005236 [Manduca sexta]